MTRAAAITPYVLLAADARFEAKLLDHPAPPDVEGPCRVWIGAQSKGGRNQKGRSRSRGGPYGSFGVAGRVIRAHIYAAFRAGIIPGFRVPEGMNVDHRCKNTLCCAHLELVPVAVNQARRWGKEVASD